MGILETIVSFVQDHQYLFIIAGIIPLGISLWFLTKTGFWHKIKQGFFVMLPLLAYVKDHTSLWILLGISVIPMLIGLPAVSCIAWFFEAEKVSTGKLIVLPIALVIVLLVYYAYAIIDVIAAHYIRAHFQGAPISLKEAARKTFRSAWLLFKFAVLHFAFDFLLNMIERKQKNQVNESKIADFLMHSTLRYAIVALVGFTWKVGTYFMPPVMTEETGSLFGCIQKSAQAMKNGFGHVVGFQLGAALLNFIAVIIIGLALIMIPLVSMLGRSLHIPSYAFAIPIAVTIVLFVLLFIVIVVALNMMIRWVFMCAAYNIATGKSAGPFDRHFIQQMIKTE